MCKIISFERYQNKKQNIDKTEQFYENSETNLAALLDYMALEVSDILNKPGIEALIEREKEDRKKFEKKYRNVLSEAPISAESQIRYFARVMLKFLPSIFHGECKNRFDAYMDFSEFYLTEFDAAYSLYFSTNQGIEKDYPFCFAPMDAVVLEKDLQNYLLQLSTLKPEKNNSDTAEKIWQACCRLFELFHNMDDLFIED